jgi:hypothetical protein
VKLERWVPVLWFIAAALALSAAAVRYVRSGEFEWGITAAGVFLLAMGLGQLKRRNAGSANTRPPDR